MNIAFLLAAGKSKRFHGDKLFALLKGKPVIYYSLQFLQQSKHVDAIFIAANTKNKGKIAQLVKNGKFQKMKKIILGGATRFVSVKKLLSTSARFSRPLSSSLYVIHNAANPLAENFELELCFRLLRDEHISGAAVGRKVQSTLKKSDGVFVEKTIPRRNVWEMETPQVVRAKDFLTACKNHATIRQNQNHIFTDDLSLLEAAGFKTALVEASPYNRKIATQEDFELMKIFAGDVPSAISVGIGEDSHRFSNEWPVTSDQCLKLGGMKIKNLPKLEAESDGDVILHALCNAVASAIGEGSLGTYATEMHMHGIRDSSQYLKKILGAMERKHRRISHCSISIEAARPKIDPIAPIIKKHLSKLLKIPANKIGITATSGERLTPFGKGLAIRCAAIVTSKD